MTARHEARNAVISRDHSDDPDSHATCIADADTVSDIWEPLLRDAVALIAVAIQQSGGDPTELVEGSTYKRLVEAIT